MSRDIKIRWGWLKFMYILTIVMAGGCGLGMLIAPELIKSMFSWPVKEPIVLGSYGSVLVAFGLLSILGLRSPLKFVPVLFFQLCYKSIWFIGVILPLLVTGKFPMYAIPLCIIFAIAIVGDIIAIPFPYVFSKRSED